MDADVIVVGAGAAGLAATRELRAAGLSVLLLEARDRIGGRLFTHHEPGWPVPIELGAEFVHGRPPETLRLLQDSGHPWCEIAGESWTAHAGRIEQAEETPGIDDIFAAIDEPREKDLSFQQLLDERFAGDDYAAARESALGYIEGFNAADARRVSVAWLAANDRAEDEVDGDRQFRLVLGYDRLLHAMGVAAHTDTPVRQIHWQPGQATVQTDEPAFTARACVITLPLRLLQESAALFQPPIPDKIAAAQQLAMGEVVRMVFRFRQPFWPPHLTFLRTPGEPIPVWWTSYPLQAAQLTGWVAGPRAEALLASGAASIRALGLATLARTFPDANVAGKLLGTHCHDWTADPFSHGSYSYVPVGALPAVEHLAAPIAGTLFFAGEATDTSGHTGTVHGALRTGQRAAREVIAALNATA